jgi:hypothetical protein
MILGEMCVLSLIYTYVVVCRFFVVRYIVIIYYLSYFPINRLVYPFYVCFLVLYVCFLLLCILCFCIVWNIVESQLQ